MAIIGGAVVAIGGFLWCGNVFHFFPTLPFAGYGTMVIGGMLMKAGRK